VVEAYRKPYFDSSVFIAWIKGEVIKGIDRGVVANSILAVAEHGDLQIYTSALTLAEVHKPRGGERLPSNLSDRILAYFEHDFIRIVDVDRNVGEQAHKKCLEHGIYPNDAIHLVCAMKAGCEVLLAWDDRFNKVKEATIRIEEPQMLPRQARLDELTR
jgi:predicted nucleic acid-binding protein